ERGATADHVLHHVHHQPGVLRVHHLVAPRLGLPEDVPLAVLDPEDADRLGPSAECSERGVGGDHLHRLHALSPDVDRGVWPGWRIAWVARLYFESSKSRPPIMARM